MTGRQRLLVIIGLLISAVFLILAFRDLQPLEVLKYVQSANLLLLLVGVVGYFAGIAMITLRWQFLLRASSKVPFQSLFQLVCIGYMGNNVYPLRGGEVLRVLLLGREHHISAVRATTVIVAERVLDGIVLLTFVVVALLTLNVASPELRSVAQFTAPVFLAGSAAFFILELNPNISRAILKWFADKMPEAIGKLVLRLGEDVIDGLSGLRTPVDLIGTVVTSYATWMLKALMFLIVAHAFSLGIDYSGALLVTGVVNLVGLIPASPGQFGVFETFTQIVLVSLGIQAEPATAYAFVMHILVVWLPVTILGFIFLARKGLGLGTVAQASQLTESKEPVL